MIVTCPICKHQFIVKRRPDGSGTEPNGAITDKEIWLRDFLKAFAKPMNVHQIQDVIYPKDIPHDKAPKGWGDHEIQRTLSLLVGRGFVEMDVSKRPYLYSVIL